MTKQNKSLNALIRKMYSNMKYRIKIKNSKGKKLEIISKPTFFLLAEHSPELKKLYNNWKRKGFALAFTPSIDRIDPDQGYEYMNIQFIPQRDNAAKQHFHNREIKATSRYVGVYFYAPGACWIGDLHYSGKHCTVGRFKSELAAAKAVDKKCIELGIPQKNNLIKKKKA